MNKSFDQRLASAYADLSVALRSAADVLVADPLDVVTRPLRKVARNSGVSPASFSRLAKALGYADFEELREEMRAEIDRRVNNFAARAGQLQKQHGDGTDRFIDKHFTACQSNLSRAVASLNEKDLDRSVEVLVNARKVLLLGALGSTGIVEYMSYMANFCSDNWFLANRMGASLGGALSGMGEDDAFLIVTKPPFASNVIKAAKLAHQMGVNVIVITDTHACPALEYATISFVVTADSANFYSSYVTTLFLIETIIGMVVARSGAVAQERIAEVELRNRQLAEVWCE
ncbi:MurR/RpiR family transcriptional regulator [Aliiroseovarius sediminis]|uniref:MurR/RpiR family transcriptional regulator n=1 Tax=Aliiroseovarius sediminis TaxID=2925839 RepID=UPI001F566694|nr:MurR/RpiR family transcriptional regulator [Aliiroseovarius sediminis]MCI2395149.1 MurR/RpiR family transcriptional regulator [Aliiroseovarius sediminis]